MATHRAPSHLGTRGRRLWRELLAEAKPGPAQLVLIEEAARIADRLDRLDAVLRGDEETWIRLAGDLEDGEVRVVVDGALAEARQQATALKGIIAELRQAGASRQAAPQRGRSTVDDLARRRADRLAASAGL